MSDKLETISDIIAKKRSIAKCIRDDASNGDYWDKKKANEEAEEYEWDADDIEAAYKRELGNTQKMRKVLERVNKFLGILIRENLVKDAPFLGEGELENESDLADDAWEVLQGFPRNCDVGTADEQYARWRRFCDSQRCCNNQCPVYKLADVCESKTRCNLIWAQMPYEKEIK